VKVRHWLFHTTKNSTST